MNEWQMSALRDFFRNHVLVAIFLLITDGSAQFSGTSIPFKVSENAPPGTVIGNLFDFTVVKPPVYPLEDLPGSLQLDPDSGVLTSSESLDREQSSLYSFLILYGDGDLAKITVEVEDQNDNAPVFDTPSLVFNISEWTPVPKCWTLTSPKDVDEGNNSVIACRLFHEASLSQFKIEYDKHSLRLALCLVQELDYEEMPFYNLTIRAIDSGEMYADLTVSVNVIDENDNVPAFEAIKYEASLDLHDAVKNNPIVTVKATDLDSGHNGDVKYSISQSSLIIPFIIDETSGVVSFDNHNNDKLLETTYSFTVKAFDAGRPSLEAEVPVFIRLTNLKQPFVSPSPVSLSGHNRSVAVTYSIHHDSPPGSFVGDLNVNPTAKRLLRNSSAVLSGGAFSSFLTLHRVTGVLTLSRWLPCDLTSIVSEERTEGHRHLADDGYHLFRLRLTPQPSHSSSGGLASLRPVSSTSAIDIIVSVSTTATTGSNCLAFRRPIYQFTIARNSQGRNPGDYCFGRVSAVGSDRCSSITYSLTAKNVQNFPVTVNSETGSLCMTADFWKTSNFLSTQVVTVQLTARNGDKTAFAVARIEITGEKEELSRQPNYATMSLNMTLPPNFRRNDTIFSLRNFEGTIENLEKPRKAIKISMPSRSSLFIDAAPCLEAGIGCVVDSTSDAFAPPAVVFQTSRLQTYNLNILPACSGDSSQVVVGLEKLGTLDVHLADFSDNFVVVDKRLEFDRRVESRVLANALRFDNSNRVWSFSLGFDCRDFAAVDPESGLIYLHALPSALKHDFECLIFAAARKFPIANSSIAVLRFIWPEKPLSTITLQPSLYFSISENSPIGSFVGTVPLSLQDGVFPSEEFSFDPKSGQLRTRKLLDRETVSIYRLKTGIVVNVVDVNDNKPTCLFPDGVVREVFIPDNLTTSEKALFYLGRIRGIDFDDLKNGTISKISISKRHHPFFTVNETTGDLYIFSHKLKEIVREFNGNDLEKLLLKVELWDDGMPQLRSDCFIKIAFRTADTLSSSVSSILPPVEVELDEDISLPFSPAVSEEISVIANFDGPLCDFIEIRKSTKTGRFVMQSNVELSPMLFDQLSCAVYYEAKRALVPLVINIPTAAKKLFDDNDELPASLSFQAKFSSSRFSTVASLKDALRKDLEFEIVICSQKSFISLDKTFNLLANWDFYFDGLENVRCVISAVDSQSSRRRLVNIFVEIAGIERRQPDTTILLPPSFVLPLTSYLANNGKILGTEIYSGMPLVSALAYTTCQDAVINYALQNNYDGLFEIDRSGLVSFKANMSSDRVYKPKDGGSVRFRLTIVAEVNFPADRETSRSSVPPAVVNFEFTVYWPKASDQYIGVHDMFVHENVPIGFVVGRLPVEKYFSVNSPISVKFPSFDNFESPLTLPTSPGWTISTTKELTEIKRFGTTARYLSVPFIITGQAFSHNSSSSSSAIVLVRLFIKDVNSQPPTFQEQTVHLSIEENVEYKNLFEAIAFHEDGPSENDRRAIVYSFSKNSSRSYGGLFSIDRGSGVVSCRALDREKKSVYNVTIFASDGVYQSSMDLIVLILDSNDNPPVVAKPRFDISLSGKERVGDKIFQVIATDADSVSMTSNNRLVYCLTDGYGFFELDSSSGDIRLLQLPPSSPRDQPWVLAINVTDSVFFTEVHVVVHLEPGAIKAFDDRKTDRNFIERPFAMSHRVAFIKEGMPKGAFVAIISPRRSEDIKFAIKSGNSDHAFGIDHQNSESDAVIVRTRTMLDAEIRGLYMLRIVAVNVTSQMEVDYTELSVWVLDVNDNEPSLSSFLPAVPVGRTAASALEVISVDSETARPGSRIGTLIGSDADASSTLSYLLMNDEAAEFLVVNYVSGDVFLRKLLPTDKVISAEFGVSDSVHRTDVRKMAISSTKNKSSAGNSDRKHQPIFDFIAEKGVYSVDLQRCVDNSEILRLLPSPNIPGFEFSLISNINLDEVLSIDKNGILTLKKGKLPGFMAEKTSFVISIRNSGTSAVSIFVYVTVTGLQKCVVQPVISASASATLLEMPRAAIDSVKPGSLLTTVETDYLTGVMFKIVSGNDDSYFGIDSEGHLRLLKPIPSHLRHFDKELVIMAINPVSQHKPTSSHTFRVHVVDGHLSNADDVVVSGDYQLVEFHLDYAGLSSRPAELFTISDYFPPAVVLISKSSLPTGRFFINKNNGKLAVSAATISGDSYAVLTSKTAVVVVIVHSTVLPSSKSSASSMIKLSSIDENSPLPASLVDNNVADADCESVCLFTAKTSVWGSVVEIPHVIGVRDFDEFPFAYTLPAFEFTKSINSQHYNKINLIGCLAPVDFDGGSAGLWQLSLLGDFSATNQFFLSPYEGCLYSNMSFLGDDESSSSFSQLMASTYKFSVKSTKTNKIARIAVHLLADQEKSTREPETTPIIKVTNDYLNNEQTKEIDDDKATVVVVLSTAIPLAFLLVALVLCLAIVFRRHWWRFHEIKKSRVISSHGTSATGNRVVVDDDDDDDGGGWIYRMVSALTTKQQTSMIRRTNSFNTIGFTSVKYESRPPNTNNNPSNNGVSIVGVGNQPNVNRSSVICSSSSQQRFSGLYHQEASREGFFQVIAPPNYREPEQVMIASNPSSSASAASCSSSGHHRAGFRPNEAGTGSVSSGVDVSSSGSGADSCSPPLVTNSTPPQNLAVVNLNDSSLSAAYQQNQQLSYFTYKNEAVVRGDFAQHAAKPSSYVTTTAPKPTSHHHLHQKRRSDNNSNYSATGGRPSVLYTRCTRAPVTMAIKSNENDSKNVGAYQIRSQYV